MKVKLSLGHKAVILSPSKLNIKSKNFLRKLFSLVCYLKIWDIKLKFDCHFITQQSFCHLFNKDQSKKLLLQKLFKLVCHFRVSYKKWKFSCHLWQSIAIYYSLSVTCCMLLAIWILISDTCYYLQKLVSFARCCTSRDFYQMTA